MKCSICGKEEALAKIMGRYYCYSCGRKLVKEHIERLLKEMERRGLVKT